jgi:hypothetical protein
MLREAIKTDRRAIEEFTVNEGFVMAGNPEDCAQVLGLDRRYCGAPCRAVRIVGVQNVQDPGGPAAAGQCLEFAKSRRLMSHHQRSVSESSHWSNEWARSSRSREAVSGDGCCSVIFPRLAAQTAML